MSEKKEEKKEKEALAKRVQGFRERLMAEVEADAEAAKKFPLLGKSVIEGAGATRDAVVEKADGTKLRVTYRALGGGEIDDAMDQAGLKLVEIGDPSKAKEHRTFERSICARAIVNPEKFTAQELGEKLRAGSLGSLSSKILFLSCFFGSAEDMDFFREESA